MSCRGGIKSAGLAAIVCRPLRTAYIDSVRSGVPPCQTLIVCINANLDTYLDIPFRSS